MSVDTNACFRYKIKVTKNYEAVFTRLLFLMSTVLPRPPLAGIVRIAVGLEGMGMG